MDPDTKSKAYAKSKDKNFNIFEPYHQSDSYTVEFRINYQTDYGQDVYMVGNISELGKLKQS